MVVSRAAVASALASAVLSSRLQAVPAAARGVSGGGGNPDVLLRSVRPMPRAFFTISCHAVRDATVCRILQNEGWVGRTVEVHAGGRAGSSQAAMVGQGLTAPNAWR